MYFSATTNSPSPSNWALRPNALGRWRNYGQGYCDMWAGAAREASFGWDLLSARAEARGGAVDAEDYLRQFLVFVMAHEVGHTLGLRHNFKASTIHPLDQLNDVRFTAKEGITSSVMEYIPVNIALGDTEQGAYFQTSLGPYDYWAIEYAYKSIDDDAESERKQLDKIAGRVADPKLPYGTDEDVMGWTTGIDPSCNRWDLGTDPIAFYRDRLALSKELWSRVESKFEKEGARYQKLSRVFGHGFGAFYGAGETVTKYIGGIYNYRDHVGDGRMPLVPVPAEKQREALQFLTEHIFGPQAFEFDPKLLNKLAPERWLDFGASVFNVRRIDHPIHDIVLNIQRGPLNRLYDPVQLGRLLDMELRFAPGKAFAMAEAFCGAAPIHLGRTRFGQRHWQFQAQSAAGPLAKADRSSGTAGRRRPRGRLHPGAGRPQSDRRGHR